MAKNEKDHLIKGLHGKVPAKKGGTTGDRYRNPESARKISSGTNSFIKAGEDYAKDGRGRPRDADERQIVTMAVFGAGLGLPFAQGLQKCFRGDDETADHTMVVDSLVHRPQYPPVSKPKPHRGPLLKLAPLPPSPPPTPRRDPPRDLPRAIILPGGFPDFPDLDWGRIEFPRAGDILPPALRPRPVAPAPVPPPRELDNLRDLTDDFPGFLPVAPPLIPDRLDRGRGTIREAPIRPPVVVVETPPPDVFRDLFCIVLTNRAYYEALMGYIFDLANGYFSDQMRSNPPTAAPLVPNDRRQQFNDAVFDSQTTIVKAYLRKRFKVDDQVVDLFPDDNLINRVLTPNNLCVQHSVEIKGFREHVVVNNQSIPVDNHIHRLAPVTVTFDRMDTTLGRPNRAYYTIGDTQDYITIPVSSETIKNGYLINFNSSNNQIIINGISIAVGQQHQFPERNISIQSPSEYAETQTTKVNIQESYKQENLFNRARAESLRYEFFESDLTRFFHLIKKLGREHRFKVAPLFTDNTYFYNAIMADPELLGKFADHVWQSINNNNLGRYLEDTQGVPGSVMANMVQSFAQHESIFNDFLEYYATSEKSLDQLALDNMVTDLVEHRKRVIKLRDLVQTGGFLDIIAWKQHHTSGQPVDFFKRKLGLSQTAASTNSLRPTSTRVRAGTTFDNLEAKMAGFLNLLKTGEQTDVQKQQVVDALKHVVGRGNLTRLDITTLYDSNVADTVGTPLTTVIRGRKFHSNYNQFVKAVVSKLPADHPVKTVLQQQVAGQER